MCTNSMFLGISWWSIWIVVGIILCLLAYDKLCAVRGITARANKFYYLLGIVAIVCGFLSASLVQSIYNYIDTKVWSWGGVTFMGGMYGGVLTFVIGGLLFAKGEVRAQFGKICEIGLTCIPIAHAFGRIGCFAVGCCYGAKVQEGDFFSFLGVMMHHHDQNGEAYGGTLRYPTQLFEAIFLIILAIVLIIMVVKDKRINSVLYFGCYAIFRFLLEFLRDDARGSIGVNALSPSQVLSILSLVIAILMFAFIMIKKYKPELAKKILHLFRLDVEMPAEVVQTESEADATENNNK